MGVRWTRVTLEDKQRKLGQAISVVQEAKGYMETIAEQGAQEMQEYIETRGTDYSAYRSSHLGRGTSGRHDSGEMVDDVSYRVVSQEQGVVNAEFGWIEDFMAYFGYQEKGTRFVKAMYALRDASTSARDKLKRAGDEIISDIAKKIG